jgi:hypothetical protein
MAEALTEYQIAALRWRKIGPAGFAKELFGVEPDEWQEEASRHLVERRRLSVRSGHGVGKSTFMAWCVPWFLLSYFPAKVPATAPTGHQLSDVLWAEIAKWLTILNQRHPAIGSLLEWTSEKIYLKSNPMESFAVARTARPEKPEALQGFHSDNILFLIDEASGVAENVFEVAEGALSTDGAFVVMAANPTRQSGYFFDSHNRMRSSWATMQVNGENCKRVSRQYIENMRNKYGVNSPIYKVRVQGEFVAATDGVIPLELCESALIRDVTRNKQPVIWGLDVARFGDDSTCLAKRGGNHQLEPCKEWFGKDTMQVVGIVKHEYETCIEKPSCINVDVIGIGAGVVDRLQELGLPVNGVNVAESASSAVGDQHYNRLRDELWFKGREWLDAKDCKLADDQSLIGELTTPKYSILSNGNIKVEGKDELKARGVASPNRADAFLLTFAIPLVANATWSQPLKYQSTGIR